MNISVCIFIFLQLSGCVTSINSHSNYDGIAFKQIATFHPQEIMIHLSYYGSGFYSPPGDRKIEAPEDLELLTGLCNSQSSHAGLTYKFNSNRANAHSRDSIVEAKIVISEIKRDDSWFRLTWMALSAVSIGLIPYWDDTIVEVSLELFQPATFKQKSFKTQLTRREYIALYPLLGDDHKFILAEPLFSQTQMPELAHFVISKIRENFE